VKEVLTFFKGLWVIACFYVPLLLLSRYVFVPFLFVHMFSNGQADRHPIEIFFIEPLLTAVICVILIGIGSLIYTAGDAFQESRKKD
jgi:hypothetical protein